MAQEDLRDLQELLPDLFDLTRARADWDEAYILVPVDDPEGDPLLDIEREVDPGELLPAGLMDGAEPTLLDQEWPWRVVPPLPIAYQGSADGIPGAPSRSSTRGKSPPPPDALAFYLPFHYFPEHLWGIYLTLEGVIALREYVRRHSRGPVTIAEATHAARVFLYAHEFFHHQVESFATRLEVDRRIPMYRGGFEALYRRQLAAGASLEEALATAHSLHKVDDSARSRKWSAATRHAVLEALGDYVSHLPANYSRGLGVFDFGTFRAERDELAEASRAESLGPLAGKSIPASIWRNSPHGFRGFADVKSRVNYLIHRSSPLAIRWRLELRYFRQREVLQRLGAMTGLRLERHGANHDVYRTENGRRVEIPRHRVLADGTVRHIIKDAGLSLSLEQFRAA